MLYSNSRKKSLYFLFSHNIFILISLYISFLIRMISQKERKEIVPRPPSLTKIITLKVIPIESIAIKKSPVMNNRKINSKYSKPKIEFSLP